jgi:hypothetical protein
MRGGPGTGDPDRIIFTNVTLLNVVLRAYQVKSYQVTAPDATPEQLYLMLQGLLKSASTWLCTTQPNNLRVTNSSGV